MMLNSADYFTWTQRLECPPTTCPAFIQKILCKGASELLWYNIAPSILPANEVIKVRKNILLYKLKHRICDDAIEDRRYMSQIKIEKEKLSDHILSLEEQYKQQNIKVKGKAQRLKRIKDAHLLLKVKKDLLRIKSDETSVQLNDCNNMRIACKQLMPNENKSIDQEKVKECLKTVSNLWYGTNKKEVWQTVSSVLGSIDTSVLWVCLFQSLQQDINKLIELGTVLHSSDPVVATGENIDIGIARMCGDHIMMISKKLLSDAKANKYQQTAMEFINQIDASSSMDYDDISEWVALVLEVQKLEVEQKCFQNTIDKIKQDLINDNNSLVSTYTEITSDIQSVDVEIEQYIKDVQRSLMRLKSAPSLITDIKDKLSYELQRIASMRMEDYNCKWLNENLTTELDIFYDILDLNAMRKIMLKGDIGSYKYTKCCFNEASPLIRIPQSYDILPYFPIIQIPIYALIECFKQFVINARYKKLESLPSSEETELYKCEPCLEQRCNYNTVELLNLACSVCERTKEEINEFNEILDAWTNQTVQDIVVFREKYVDDASFSEWLQRYSLYVYMIQNSK